MTETVSIITNLPATDGNFITALNRASETEIRQAIIIMEQQKGDKHKTRIDACRKEIKRRKKRKE